MIVLLLSLLLSPAHAGRRTPPPDVVEDALAFATTDRNKAITLLENALSAGPRSKEVAVISVHAGEQRRLASDDDLARSWFEQALTAQPDGPWTDAARLGLVLLEAHGGLNAAAVSDLRRIGEKDVLESQNADRFLLLAVDATQRGEAGKVNQYSKRALSYASSDPSVLERVRGSLAKLAAGDTVNTGPTAEGGMLDRARTALEKGDRARAAELARKATEEAEPGSFALLSAQYMVKRAEATSVINPDKIAVLLPMSGKYEAVGRQVQQAFEFGYKAGGGTRKLIFMDTHATPEGAVAALELAVLNEGVIGVAGPLLSDANEPVVEAAAALEVPLVNLSQANESDEHRWVFQGVPSIGDQADALVDFVMDQEQMKAFAIFAPDTNYGKRAAAEFREAVEAKGGVITVETFYDPKATALMSFAVELGRKDIENRKWELHKLKQEAEEKGGNPDSVVIPPTIDFDGLFLPDNARKIPIAAAALAYEEFPIGEFRPRRSDKLIPLLGLSGWNNHELVAAGGEYVRGSRFTDAFYTTDSEEFVLTYKAALGRSPGSIEAIAADAARALGAATRSPLSTREDLRAALDAVEIDGAPTGASGFDPERRRIQSRIRVLSIDRDNIVPVDVEAPE